MTNTIKSEPTIPELIRDLYKKVLVSDHPEAEQFAADMNRAFVRSQRLIKKEVLAKGKRK